MANYIVEAFRQRDIPWKFYLRLDNGGMVNAKGRGMIRFRIAVWKANRLRNA